MPHSLHCRSRTGTCSFVHLCSSALNSLHLLWHRLHSLHSHSLTLSLFMLRLLLGGYSHSLLTGSSAIPYFLFSPLYWDFCHNSAGISHHILRSLCLLFSLWDALLGDLLGLWVHVLHAVGLFRSSLSPFPLWMGHLLTLYLEISCPLHSFTACTLPAPPRFHACCVSCTLHCCTFLPHCLEFLTGSLPFSLPALLHCTILHCIGFL